MSPDLEALEAIRARLPDADEIPSRFVHEVDEALRRFPQSTALLCFRGVLIQLGPEDGEFGLEDARRSFERALELDPSSAEASEQLGWLCYVMEDDPRTSIAHFTAAVEAGGGPDAWAGLIRALTDLGRLEEAEEALGASEGLTSEALEEARSDLLDALDGW